MTSFSPAVHSSKRAALEFHVRKATGLALRAARRLVATGITGSMMPAQPPPDRSYPVEGPPRVLIVDAHAPRPDLDSGSVRMVALIRIFHRMGLSPALFVDDFRPLPVDAPLVPTGDVRDFAAARAWLARHAETLRLVVLSRYSVAWHWLPLIRVMLPGVPIVFDTVDLHFVREKRQASHERSRLLAALSSVTRHRELALFDAADSTWVVSPSERILLSQLLPSKRVACISNIVDPLESPPGMAERHGFLFLGNFRHEPNADAARWLFDLWPRIRRHCSSASLSIVGPYLPREIARKLSALPGVHIAGHVEELAPYLQNARVMLAPLRYGAGVKGKLNSAFAHGLPVVATSIAAEGMQVDGRGVVAVADTLDEFVQKSVHVHEDPALWEALQTGALEAIDRHFSTEAVERELSANLQDLGILARTA